MKTVIERVLDECARAFRYRRPLIFLDTWDLDLIRRVAASDRLVVRVRRLPGNISERHFAPCRDYTDKPSLVIPHAYGETAEDEKLVLNVNWCTTINWISDDNSCPFPKMFVMAVAPEGSEQRMNPDMVRSLLKFIDQYEREPDDNGLLRSSVVLLYGNPAALPESLRSYCEIVKVPLPEKDELAQMLFDEMSKANLDIPPEDALSDIAYALTGFSSGEARYLIRDLLSAPLIDDTSAIYDWGFVQHTITHQKVQMLSRERLLQLISVPLDLDIGGMSGFREWFTPMAGCFSDLNRMLTEAGVAAPRGVLMCGIPGCGKSLAAKCAARLLDKPLLRLEVGQLMGRYVGESERNMAKALQMAEAMSPCVLWIDELEKGFSGASASEDNGIFKRMFGNLLTWMQENTHPCFIFATANDISGLPPELFRSGRFDELFAVFMPTRDECVEILSYQMRAAERRSKRDSLFDIKCYDQNWLANIVDGFCSEACDGQGRFVTGADIEKLVTSALRILWQEGNASETIRRDTWESALMRTLKNMTVYGDSEENRNRIAITTLQLIRGNFRSAAGEDHDLFCPKTYELLMDAKGDIQSVTYEPRVRAKRFAYDKALQEDILRRINRFAPRLESNNVFQLLR